MQHRIGSDIRDAHMAQDDSAFYVPGKGRVFGWGTTLPPATSTIWAKGAAFILIDGAADTNLHINEAADGEGTAPSWVAVPTP